MEKTVTQAYLLGILEGRDFLRQHGAEDADGHIANLRTLCKMHSASSTMGQMFRGELDFWRNQLSTNRG